MTGMLLVDALDFLLDARKQRERDNPTLSYRDKLQALTPAERAHNLIEIAQDIINRAREMLGPGCTGPERPA